MPTINRDQINAGAAITDPAFRDAEESAAASGGEAEGSATSAEASPPAEDRVEDGGGSADAPGDATAGSNATADVPRMDEIEESGVTGFENRLDERLEGGFELPDAARQHMGTGRADDPDAKPFEAPRSWSDAGAEHAAPAAFEASGPSAASAAGDGGDEGREHAGGGADWRQTNGTPHPSEDARGDDGSIFEAGEEPGGYENAPDFDSSRGGESEGRGRGGADRDAEELEPEA